MIDFNILWRYFAWSNQALSVFTLWALTVFLVRERKGLSYLITLFPALFMTVVCVSYILFAPEGLSLGYALSVGVGLGVALLLFTLFVRYVRKVRAAQQS